MIVITGAGRCGTSLIAKVYAEAGEHPGGRWDPRVDAGYEDPEVVDLNRRLLQALGGSLLGRQRPLPRPETLPAPRLMERVKQAIPPRRREQIRRVNNSMPWNRPRSLRAVDWGRAQEVVATHAADLRNAAASRILVKDPQFALTLPLWLDAGAQIDHVVVMTRSIDAMLASRESSDMLGYRNAGDARNALLLASGTLTTTVADHPDLPRTVIRFPDILSDLSGLSRRLPPTVAATPERLEAALRATVDTSMIHQTTSAGES